MTPGRKEPTFSSNLGAEPPEESRRTRASASSPQAASYAPVVQPSSGGNWFGTLLGLVALGLAGFLFWQWTLTQEQLLQSEQRIAQLEKQLTLSGDEASQSVTVLQANLKKSNESLKVAHSELRKLWDTRNVNKRAISDNKASIGRVQKRVDQVNTSLQKEINDAKQLADRVSGSIKALKTQITGVAALQDEQNVRLEALDKVESDIKALKKQINGLKSSANQLNSLSKSVKEHDEILKSVDAYRVSTNRQILDLRNRLGAAP